MSKQKAIIVSGYFNPIHKGHLEYFNNAKAITDKLFVIVNNDHQIDLIGIKEFQDENECMILFLILKRWIRQFSRLIQIEPFVPLLK